MQNLRKFNFIDLYFDEFGNLIPKRSTKSLFPSSNYQSILYVNFEAVNVQNFVGVTVELPNGVLIDELPMRYIGKFSNDGLVYDRYELPLPSLLTQKFRRDRDTILGVQFIERELGFFIGVYSERAELDLINAEDGMYAYVLEDGFSGLYLFNEEEDTWELTNSIKTFNQVLRTDLTEITIRQGLRAKKVEVDVDVTDIILKSLAILQSTKVNTEDLKDVVTDIVNEILNGQ